MPNFDDFAALQATLPTVLARDRLIDRTQTIIVLPSFTVDRDLLARVPSMEFWEHRMLFMLGKLRDPSLRMIFATSQRVSPDTVKYYVDLIPGLDRQCLDRLTLLECRGPSSEPLTAKLLKDADALGELRVAAAMTHDAYLEPFASTGLERDLAVALGIPLNGCDPVLARFGLKSGARRLLRDLGIPTPPGIEGVRGLDAVVDALVQLKEQSPRLRRAVIKLDDSLAGIGNGLVSFDGWPAQGRRAEWMRRRLDEGLELAFPLIDRERFFARLEEHDCIVEHHIDGPTSRSPSAQCQINPFGEVTVVSTHDQQLSGGSEMHFSGCAMPARAPAVLHESARAVGDRLRDEGVVGPFGVDFITVEHGGKPEHYALEINLRNVGTTHHLATLHNLAGGGYDLASGQFITDAGNCRAYYGSDSVKLDVLSGRPPADLLPIAAAEGLTFDGDTETGVVLHMVDAARPFGRIGLTCVGRTIDDARLTFQTAIRRLDQRCRAKSRR